MLCCINNCDYFRFTSEGEITATFDKFGSKLTADWDSHEQVESDNSGIIRRTNSRYDSNTNTQHSNNGNGDGDNISDNSKSDELPNCKKDSAVAINPKNVDIWEVCSTLFLT